MLRNALLFEWFILVSYVTKGSHFPAHLWASILLVFTRKTINSTEANPFILRMRCTFFIHLYTC